MNARRICSLFLCLALLFSRVALAAFTCPMEMLASPAAAVDDCDKGDAAGSPLCQKSCNDEPQKQESAAHIAVAPAVVSTLWVSTPEPRLSRFRWQEPVLARANAPPLILLTARIRE
jgi:hypothetical protein